jgi:tetratricopeptide (TPR) repeat protein
LTLNLDGLLMSRQRLSIVAVLLFGTVGPQSGVSFGQATLAQAYLDSAEAARRDGKTAKAARLYALALTEAHGRQHELLTAKALLGAATIHIELSEFDQAEENVRAALALCESLPTPPAQELATALNCMAIVSFHRRKFEQAEACYAKLLSDLKSDENLALRGIVTNDLALVKIALDEPGEGTELAHDAADIMEDQFGPASAQYAQCLDTLAQALLANGQPDEAETVANQSLEICAADIGKDSAQYGATLLTLSKIQHASGDHAAAVHAGERSIALQEETRGAAHPLTNRAEQELATMRADHSVRAAARRPSPDELKMFDEMYAGLGLTPDELAALLDHWLDLNGPERLDHYLDFQAEVAARRAVSALARRPSVAKPAASGEPATAKVEDDETLFQELFGRHKLPPNVLKQRRQEWDRMTPQQRRAAAALFRQSIRSQVTAK